MRIAVSGTHCCGKTTLIDEFLSIHPDFVHEPEPYSVLVEDYGEEFSAEPSADEFYRQLEFNAARLNEHKRGENVIYERSPVDFLAYMIALKDLYRDRSDSDLLESAQQLVSDAVRNLDLIVFLPLNQSDREIAEDEHPRLRSAVD